MIERDIKRIDKLEATVGTIEKLSVDLSASKNSAKEAKDQIRKIEQDLTMTVKTIGTVKTSMDDAIKKIEADSKAAKDTEKNIALLESELAQTTTVAKTAKTSADDAARKVDRIRKW